MNVAIDHDVDAGNLAAIQARRLLITGETEVVMGDPKIRVLSAE